MRHTITVQMNVIYNKIAASQAMLARATAEELQNSGTNDDATWE